MAHEEDDHLEALSKAKASVRKNPAAAKSKYQQQAKQKQRGSAAKSVAALVILLMGAAGGYFVFNMAREQNKPPPVVETKKAPPKPTGPDEIQSDHKKELEAKWEKIVKTHAPTRGFKPLLDKGGEQLKKIAAFWEQARYNEAMGGFEEMRKVMLAIGELDEAKSGAVESRISVASMSDEAQAADAPQLVPQLWEEAEKAFAQADRQFREDVYAEALTGWQAASEAYGRAAVSSGKAKSATLARRAFESDLVRRFSREIVEKYGGEAKVKSLEIFEAGHKEYAALRFDESLKKYQEADKLVPQVELSVQRKTGAHYYAVQAGYQAAGMLMKRAAGSGIAESAWKELKQSLADLGLPADAVSGVAGQKDVKYAALSAALMDQVSGAIAAAHGEKARDSFAFGVQVRLVERLLETDADTFARQESEEIRRCVVVMSRLSTGAGYPPATAEALKKLTTTLVIKPEFEAMHKCRDLWSDLIRKLEKFDEAMKLLPPSAPLPGAEAKPDEKSGK